MSHDALLVFCTVPDPDVGEEIGQRLVADRLAACVNIVAGLTSIYEWQGKIERDHEHLLLIKTTRVRFPALEAAIKAQHPYELPEIIAVPIDAASPEYLRWIIDSTAP